MIDDLYYSSCEFNQRHELTIKPDGGHPRPVASLRAVREADTVKRNGSVPLQRQIEPLQQMLSHGGFDLDVPHTRHRVDDVSNTYRFHGQCIRDGSKGRR